MLITGIKLTAELLNKQGEWINNNAIFVKDYFDEPHYDELTNEETIGIRWDKDE